MAVYAPTLTRRPKDGTQLARGGCDERAFEEIFKRHHSPLLAYCQHMLGSREEAEDALQQAFLRAHRALTRGSRPRELRPWLYAIARNCCLSAIAARRPVAALEDRQVALAGLSEQVHEREELRELVADIGRLPEAQRSALLLAELEDLDHRAIASVVGCPVSKVKALVFQARTTLIAQREARALSCQEIREQLAVGRGGELRRGPLRRHLSLCAGCRDFQDAVAAQRQSLALVLPVLPSAGFALRVLGATHAAGVGGGGAASTVASSGVGASAATPTSAAGGFAGTASATSTGTSVLAGGSLLTKVAVGGAVAALATAGATVIPHQFDHATRGSAVAANAAAQTGAAFARNLSSGGATAGVRPVRAAGQGTAWGTSPSSAGNPPPGPVTAGLVTGLAAVQPLATLLTASTSPTPAAGTTTQPTGTITSKALLGNPAARGPRLARHRRRARIHRLRHRRHRRHRPRVRHRRPHKRLHPQIAPAPRQAPPTSLSPASTVPHRTHRRRSTPPAPAPAPHAGMPTRQRHKIESPRRRHNPPPNLPTFAAGRRS